MSFDVGNVTSCQMGCSLADGIESAIGLNYLSDTRLNKIARRITASSSVYLAPVFLPMISDKLSPFYYLSFQNRTFYSLCYNSMNSTGYALSSLYHLAKRNPQKARENFQMSLRHGWRAV